MGQVLDSITPFAEEIRADGAEGDKLMRLTDRSAKRLRDSGGSSGCSSPPSSVVSKRIRANSPRLQWGGSEPWTGGRPAGSPASSACTPWEMAFFDPKAQEEVWGGNDPDTWIASPYAPPMGVATPPVDGGYILNGRWSFSSGTDHCDWVMIGAAVGDKDGNRVSPPKSLHVLVPRSDYRIDQDSWNVVGAARHRVQGPHHRERLPARVPDLSAERVMGGVAWRDAGRDETLYRFPFSCIFPLGITSR